MILLDFFNALSFIIALKKIVTPAIIADTIIAVNIIRLALVKEAVKLAQEFLKYR